MFYWLLNRDVGVSGVNRIRPGAQKVGRSLDCDLCIDDISVSREHALLLCDQNLLIVRDLGSFNGTFVNDIKRQESPLRAGDIVRFGGAAFDVIHSANAGKELGLENDSRTLPMVESAPHEETVPERLTNAQRKVLRLLLRGLSEKQVAQRLSLSVHTVHNHVKEIYRELGFHSRAELMAGFHTAGTSADDEANAG